MIQTHAVTNLSRVKFTSSVAYFIYKRVVDRMTGFKKGAQAAKSLAKQRKLLSSMHECVKAGHPAQAQVFYHAWKKERAQYLVLVNWY